MLPAFRHFGRVEFMHHEMPVLQPVLMHGVHIRLRFSGVILRTGRPDCDFVRIVVHVYLQN